MAGLSNERIQEFKNILEKKKGKEISWEEAAEGARSLVGLFEVLHRCWVDEQIRKKKLEEHPNGFQLDGIGYTCFICGGSTPVGGNWYDKYGIKCKICQGAIVRKEIPASLAKNRKSWYSKYEIEDRFNIKGPTLRSWIKNGILKARTVTHDGKGVHAQLFLIKDNKDTLPPKKMTESQLVKETKEGKDWFHSEPWYRCVDPKEHLKGYKIMDYLQVVKK